VSVNVSLSVREDIEYRRVPNHRGCFSPLVEIIDISVSSSSFIRGNSR
jgi:hypothetical protein